MTETDANIRADILSRIETELAKPITHVAIVTFSDGAEWRVDTRSAAAAENFVGRYRPLIGTHQYISRRTNAKVTITAVRVEEV